MNWNVETNIFGGRSISIPAGGDLRDLPRELTRLLTAADRKAHQNPKVYFQKLANKSELDGPKRFFEALAQTGECTLQIHSAEPVPGHFQSDVLFRVDLRRRRGFGFRLPCRKSPYRLSPVLKQLYSTINGTVEGDVWDSGGLEPVELVGLIIGDLGIKKPGPYAGSDGGIESFYGTDSGDLLFAHDDKAVWFLHESCDFVEAGQLTDVINRYFDSLVDGGPWLPNPY